MTDDRLSTALEEIRERNEQLRHRYGYVGGLLTLANAKDDIPRLLAAVDGVLAEHKPAASLHIQPCPEHRAFIGMDEVLVDDARRNYAECVYEEGGTCSTCHDRDGDLVAWPCPTYLVISSALLGEETDG